MPSIQPTNPFALHKPPKPYLQSGRAAKPQPLFGAGPEHARADSFDHSNRSEPAPLLRADSLESVNSNNPPLLLSAVVQNDIAAVRDLIQKGLRVNEAAVDPEDDATPLIVAAEKNHLAIAELLLNAGADINRTESYERTPLMKAVLEGHYPMVQLLLQHKALVHLQDAEGECALSYSIKYQNDKRITERLLRHPQATQGLCPKWIWTLADRAAMNDQFDVVKHLVSLPELEPLFQSPIPERHIPAIDDDTIHHIQHPENNRIRQCLIRHGLIR